MGLDRYAAKRKFDESPEPRPRAIPRRQQAPRFVVQLHDARTRHYDFRLEVDGVLKSWAVPKGPSLRAGEKRLAVEVEDHPIDYADFEGDIPEGHYGAGQVRIFDSGTWTTDTNAAKALENGKLGFSLHGRRLRGAFELVRTKRSTKQQQWLLFKRKDVHAADRDADDLLDEKVSSVVQPRAGWAERVAAFPGARPGFVPADFALALTQAEPTPPSGRAWLHEAKWDGYRMAASMEQGKVSLRSRNGLDWSGEYPEVAAALAALPVESVRLDGELVVLDAAGNSSFAELQASLKSGQTARLCYVVFDVVGLEGWDLRAVALVARKALLQGLLQAAPSPCLRYSSHVVGNGPVVFAASGRAGLEGIVSKRCDSHYEAGRSGAWLKTKHHATEDFFVVGYTRGQGARAELGALLLGRRVAGGLTYVGKVGTGFDASRLSELLQRLRPLVRTQATVELPPHARLVRSRIQWVEPRLIVEVASRGWGKEGLLRQASFQRLRDDKELSTQAATAQILSAPSERRVSLTHPDKILFPESGITKARVFEYYQQVGPWMLPELAGRPLSLLRTPAGIAAKGFFQKHHSDAFGEHVLAVELRQKSGLENYFFIDSLEGLLELVQMNALEFHPWGSRATDVEHPDRMVLDLDPADDVEFSAVREAARGIRERLSRLGLRSFVRTSGGKGLHVVVPFARGPSWGDLEHFSEAFARLLANDEPQRFVATMSKARRRGRIFVDWLRNGRGSTSVASWSLRARPGAPVALPVDWSELEGIEAADTFKLADSAARAQRITAAPWSEWAAAGEQVLPRFPREES